MAQAGEALAAGQFFGAVSCRCAAGGALLSELRHERSRQFPHHCHEQAYFGLLLAGGYNERLGSRSFPQRPTTLAFHPPWTDHHDEIEAPGTRMLIVEAAPHLLDRARDGAPPALEFRLFAGGRPVGLAAGLYRELRRGEPGADLRIEELLLDLLAAALCPPGRDESREPAWLRRVDALLRDGFREALALDRLAAEAGVHPVHLTRTFRRFRGCTPGEQLQQLRVERVCEGLADPELSLAELALDAGFADQSHCTRVFRRLVGLTPGAVRARLRGEGN